VLSAVVILVPVIWNLGLSFTRWQGVGSPEWIGLDNYKRLFQDENFWASFRHSALIVVAMAVVPTVLGLIIAAVLFDYVGKKFGNRSASAFRSGLYIPQVLPVAVSGIVWGWLLMPSGAVNTLFKDAGLNGLAKDWLGDPNLALLSVMAILVWIQLGYPVVMFMAGLQRVNPELYEAAEVDGATWWQRFTKITIYQVRPEIYVVLVTTTIAALKTFAQVYVLTRGGPGNATLVPSYFAYRSFFEVADVGYGSAISSIMVVLILVIGTIFVRLQTRAGREEF
jgi:raffinose/stachyose/melibiose transport system permease protein